MSNPESLSEVYLEEMKDLWSANDQMTKALKQLSGHAHDKKLKTMFENSIEGIAKHTETIKGLIEGAGGKVKPDHCKGMEGLVTEALKHGIKEAPTTGPLQDLEMISQYQRMSHYGIAGFGSAAAYAKALGKADDEKKLKSIVSDIYKGDEYATHFAVSLQKQAA